MASSVQTMNPPIASQKPSGSSEMVPGVEAVKIPQQQAPVVEQQPLQSSDRNRDFPHIPMTNRRQGQEVPLQTKTDVSLPPEVDVLADEPTKQRDQDEEKDKASSGSSTTTAAQAQNNQQQPVQSQAAPSMIPVQSVEQVSVPQQRLVEAPTPTVVSQPAIVEAVELSTQNEKKEQEALQESLSQEKQLKEVEESAVVSESEKKDIEAASLVKPSIPEPRIEERLFPFLRKYEEPTLTEVHIAHELDNVGVNHPTTLPQTQSVDEDLPLDYTKTGEIRKKAGVRSGLRWLGELIRRMRRKGDQTLPR